MKELNETESKALAAVNAAVNPYGFKAMHMDTIEGVSCGKEYGEIWFTLWFMDESKQKDCKAGFEAIYYTKPNEELKRGVGAIGFGIMDNDFTDLPDNPAKACEVYARWSRQKPLEKMIAEVSALTEPLGLQGLAVALELTPLQITQLNEIGSQIEDGYETYNSVCDSLSREEDTYLRKWLEDNAGMTFKDGE